ncbi:hypothetical protein NBM05_06705 [Rothia sp. AR01]|uniref:Uncharacterized protein n=1 Tax=Rothia santali TaxID=2949643 RepID=A0A9X2KI73_9MICC|nr:hypothetical protein [Rothia santali]MCP3425710.1 hypothetical protein [Rothia santali]
MTTPLQLDVDHSHLFPGARLRCAPGGPDAPGRAVAVEVGFRDGSGAEASLEVLQAATGRYLLEVGPYESAAGTAMPAKGWITVLARDEDGLAADRGDVAGGGDDLTGGGDDLAGGGGDVEEVGDEGAHGKDAVERGGWSLLVKAKAD